MDPTPPAPKLGLLSGTVGFHIARAAVVAYEAFERHIGQVHDLRKVDYSLLMLLWSNESLAPKQLVPLLALTPPKLTMVLDRLQQRGLIRRQTDPLDRRSQRVSLSAEGRRLARRLAPAAQAMEEELDTQLSPTQRQQLIMLLEKLGEPRR